jgi:hypothetical protein
MHGMSRLAPLISRRDSAPRAVAMALPATRREPMSEAEAAAWLADLRLFVTAWLGGVVFIGTLLS